MLWQLMLVWFGLSCVNKGLDSWMPLYLLQQRGLDTQVVRQQLNRRAALDQSNAERCGDRRWYKARVRDRCPRARYRAPERF